MARQVEGSLPALERTDEPPVLAADNLRKLELGGPASRPETADALDRSLEALRETLERAETRWQQLEARLAEQDRKIRELQEELSRANSKRPSAADLHISGVPELTEIVTTVVANPHPAAADDLSASPDDSKSDGSSGP